MANPPLARHVLTPPQDAPELGRILLRDGTTALLRPALPEDLPLLMAMGERLSPLSRYRRFFSASAPTEATVASLCDSRNPSEMFTLLVIRTDEGEPRVIATGSYFASDAQRAEVAFVVADDFQGKGLATALLERLALIAVQHGFTHFWAVSRADNAAIRDVFRDSGFPCRESDRFNEIEYEVTLIPDAATVAKHEMRERIATVASLRPFFHPRGVAVIGASREPQSIGYRIVAGMQENGFQGAIYPINPKASEIAGIPAFPSICDVPGPVDLAVLSVPKHLVLPVVDDCAAKGIRALVVITAGFAEMRGEGAELQKQLVDKVRGYGMRLIGPNCLGILNADPKVKLNASFSPVFPPSGRVAMSSQSGALGLAILAAARSLHLGLSTFVSVGNKADVSGNDLLQYWEEDPNTDLILLYLESFGNPRRFARIARRVGHKKPVVVLKAGRSSSGARAASSHTAALAVKDVAVDALFHQAGVIRVDTLQDMFELAAAVGSQPLPNGGRIGIITNAGGPGILCADACETSGLSIPVLSPATQEALRAFLPAAASPSNPVDLIASASPEQYGKAITTVMASGEVDALIVIHIPLGLGKHEDFTGIIAESVAQTRAQHRSTIPVLGCWMSDPGASITFQTGNETIPAYAFPEAPARVLGQLVHYQQWRSKPVGIIPEFPEIDLPRARAIVEKGAQESPSGWLAPELTRQLLESFQLPVALGRLALTADEAASLADAMGYPVVVKLASRTLVHKTEVGGVILNLTSAEAVRQAYASIWNRLHETGQSEAMEGVLVQPMIRGGVELMIGVAQDPQLGPLIAFGLGGVHVEILKDVCFRITPLTDQDADEMIHAIRGYRLLTGYRGHPPADIPAIRDVLLRVSRLVEEFPAIREIDFNPILALPPGEGCRIVDARIRMV